MKQLENTLASNQALTFIYKLFGQDGYSIFKFFAFFAFFPALLLSAATPALAGIQIDDYVQVTITAGNGTHDGTNNTIWVSAYNEDTGTWSPSKAIAGGMGKGEKKVVTISHFNDPSISQVAVYVGSSDGLGAKVRFYDPFNPGGGGAGWCWKTNPSTKQWIKGKWVYFDIGWSFC